jgi:creatinine amidohydrolase
MTFILNGDDPFDWIKAHRLMAPEAMGGYPFDHAGIGGTSLLMDLCPEGVDLSKASDTNWYSRGASQSLADYGAQARECILAQLRKALWPGGLGSETWRRVH